MTDDLRTEAVNILSEIPTAYVRLHLAVSAPRRKKGSGVRVSGGVRDYVPLNVEADAYKVTLVETVVQVHTYVAETFGEIPLTTGIERACSDLVRWSDIWTRMPDAPELVEKLRATLRKSNRLTGNSEGPSRLPQQVCPNCLQVGGMYLLDGVGGDEEYGCDKCTMSWNPDGYWSAITEVLARHGVAT